MRTFKTLPKLTRLQRWWPPALMRRIKALEAENITRRISADHTKPSPVWIAGDPRFPYSQNILCRIQWEQREIAGKSVGCFVVSEEQEDTLIGTGGLIVATGATDAGT